MQAATTPPEHLRHLLIHIAERAMRLVAPAYAGTLRNRLKSYAHFIHVIGLATQLIHQLPKLAVTLARRRTRPLDQDSPHRPERQERPNPKERQERRERQERFSLRRPVDVPALVDHICRELLALAKLVSQHAHDEIADLATRAKQAAQSWQRMDMKAQSSPLSASPPATPVQWHGSKPR